VLGFRLASNHPFGKLMKFEFGKVLKVLLDFVFLELYFLKK